jgi:hypothetical protein
MVSLGGSEDAARAWSMHAFDPGPGYAGAIAYRAEPRLVRGVSIVSMDELLAELSFE